MYVVVHNLWLVVPAEITGIVAQELCINRPEYLG